MESVKLYVLVPWYSTLRCKVSTSSLCIRWAIYAERCTLIVLQVKMHTNCCSWHNQYRLLITHAGIAAGVGIGRSVTSVCTHVRPLTGKRLELSTPNLVHVYSIAVARHALTPKSKSQRSRSHGYKNRHGRTVASDACCNGLCWRGYACRFDCLCFLVWTLC